MNLWFLISSIVTSLGLTLSPISHVPLISFNDNQVTLQDRVINNVEILPQKINNNSWGVDIQAKSAGVIDKKTGLILWQKNAEEQRSLASITKLMTALVFLENNPGWNTSITMIKKDEVNGGNVNILRGETVKVKNLFYTSLIASDNNATNALVRSTGLEKNQFISLMNKKARELGLENTSFVGVTGLNNNNISTALDILKLARKAFSNEDIKEVTSHRVYSFYTSEGKFKKVYSTNKLLDSYLNIQAGKTGYITASGYCLVSEVLGNTNEDIITVVLGSDTHDGRFYDLKVLSAWILDNFNWS